MVPTYLTTVVNYGTEYNEKEFPVHIASMLHGAQVGADNLALNPLWSKFENACEGLCGLAYRV